jgi:hypothetical protein
MEREIVPDFASGAAILPCMKVLSTKWTKTAAPVVATLLRVFRRFNAQIP